jgi:hypothetical protein
MYHVEIRNKLEALEFLAWIGFHTDFPLEIYLNGHTYTFQTQAQKDLFQLGFHAAYDVFHPEP